MPHPPESTACERLAALLDALPDAPPTGNPLELHGLDRHVAACPRCLSDWQAAQALARATARLPRPACPPEVALRVLTQVEALAAAARVHPPRLSFWQRARLAAHELPSALARHLTLQGLLRPALVGGAAALVAAVLVVSSRHQPTPTSAPERTYSAAEVAQAQAQLQLALAYLGRMGQETGTVVKEEVLEHLIAPTFRAFGPPTFRAFGPAGVSSEGRD